MAEPVKITVSKFTLYRPPGTYQRYAFGTYYECTGPDGTQFNNTSIKTLRDVLKRRYGRVELTIERR